MVPLSTLAWYAFMAVCLLAGAVFSAWVFFRYRTDSKRAEDHRESIMSEVGQMRDLLASPPDGEDLDPAEVREGMASIQEQQLAIIEAINATSVYLEDLPKRVRLSIEGSMGRKKRTENEQEQEVYDSLDQLADSQMIQHIDNPIAQGILGKVMETGDPRVMAMARNWLASRPDVARQLQASQQAALQAGQQGNGATGPPVSDLDQYTT